MKRKNSFDLVGAKFKTLRDAEITVVDYIRSGDKTMYVMVCSFCSEDTELFPYGSIVQTKDRILKGSFNCGCCRPRWNEMQYKILVKRICKENDYSFLGWHGEFKGNKTKLLLKNNKTSYHWNTTDINKLFLGRKDPSERGVRTGITRSLPIDILSDRLFRSGRFLEGTIFCQRSKPKTCLYRCPKCSVDEYVSAGVCSGVFSISYDKSEVHLSCRCSKAYRWTQDQRKLQIQLLMGRGEEFLYWDTESPKNKQKFFWRCKEGHTVKTGVTAFVCNGNRCRKCAKHGYSIDKAGWFYLVRWYDTEFSTLKYGITNQTDFETRIKDQSKGTLLKYDVIFATRFIDGSIPLEVEDHVKAHFGTKGFCDKSIFKDGFTETIEECKENIDFIVDFTKHYTTNLI